MKPTKPQLPKDTVKAVFRGLLQTNKTSSAKTIILQHYPYATEWIEEAIVEEAAKKTYGEFSYIGKSAQTAVEPEAEPVEESEPIVQQAPPPPPPKGKSKGKTKQKPEPVSPPTARPSTKLDQARKIWEAATDRSRKAIVPILVKELGMTESGATSYFYKLGK